MTYEILGYKSQADYECRRSEEIIDGIDDKLVAIAAGWVATRSFPIIKVQSEDREEISVLRDTAQALIHTWVEECNAIERPAFEPGDGTVALLTAIAAHAERVGPDRTAALGWLARVLEVAAEGLDE